MGIHHFYGWWVANLPIEGINLPPEVIASLWFDLNGIIYRNIPAIYGHGIEDMQQRNQRFAEITQLRESISKGVPAKIKAGKAGKAMETRIENTLAKTLEKQLFVRVFKDIVNVIARVNSYNRVYNVKLEMVVLAIDGIAPVAKMKQQRHRRFMAAASSATGSSGFPHFNTNAISPGTAVMRRFDKFLREQINAHEDDLARHIVYTSHQVIGEGEHKIMDMIKQRVLEHTMPTVEYREPGREPGRETGIKKRGGAHVVWGLDADLIHLTNLLPPEMRDVYLLRDSPDAYKAEHKWFFFNCTLFRDYIEERLGTPTAVTDFTVMTTLLGNDFLPIQPAFVNMRTSVDFIIEVYKANQPCVLTKLVETTGVRRTSNGGIEVVQLNDVEVNLEGLVKLLAALGNQEDALLAREATRKVTFWVKSASDKSGKPQQATTDVFARHPAFTLATSSSGFDPSIFAKVWYDAELGRGGATYTDASRMDMAHSYLQGIAWVFRYYTRGFNYTNFEWLYRYNYAPLMADLAYVVQTITTAIPSITDGYLKASDDSIALHRIITPFGPDPARRLYMYHQLLSILPYASRSLLPAKFRQLMECRGLDPDEKSKHAPSPISYLYPSTVKVEFLWIETDKKHDIDQSLMVVLPTIEFAQIYYYAGVVVSTMTDKQRERLERYYGEGEVYVRIGDPAYYQVKAEREADIAERMAEIKRRREAARRGRGESSGRGRGDRGRGDAGRGREEFGRGRSDFGRGRGEVGRDDFGRGRGDFGRGRGDFGRGREKTGRERGDFGRGRGEFGRGREEVSRSRGEFGRGREEVSRSRGRGRATQPPKQSGLPKLM